MITFQGSPAPPNKRGFGGKGLLIKHIMEYKPGNVQQFTKIMPPPKLTAQALSILVYNLVNDTPDFIDMVLIQQHVNHVMGNWGASFNDFADLDVQENEADYINKFSSVEQMFFDRINSQKTSLVAVEHLVNLCVNL